jgi:hypothetical protein
MLRTTKSGVWRISLKTMVLTAAQRQELNAAILDYLRSQGFAVSVKSLGFSSCCYMEVVRGGCAMWVHLLFPVFVFFLNFCAFGDWELAAAPWPRGCV